jgi:hypothetical protein
MTGLEKITIYPVKNARIFSQKRLELCLSTFLPNILGTDEE